MFPFSRNRCISTCIIKQFHAELPTVNKSFAFLISFRIQVLDEIIAKVISNLFS